MSKKTVLSPNETKQCRSSSSAAEIIASNVDLLTEILLRVPAKSLIKFKSVSKQWLSLISDSRFGRNHTHQTPSPPLSGLYFYSKQYRPLRLDDQITRFSVHDHQPTSLPNLSFLDDSGSRSVTRVLHSSNGLLLCSNFDTLRYRVTNYVISNLTTQKFVLLSTPVISKSFNKFGSYLVFYPKKSPYYKVVVVSSSYDSNTSQFDVYSSENASWKSLILTPKIHNHSTAHGAVWNGEIILLSCSDRENSCAKHDHFCVRFDIDAKKLTTTRLPYLDNRLSRRILYFGECSGHLLLVQRSWNDPTNFEVLEMVEGENNFQWTVKYSADLTPLILPGRRSCRFSVISVMNVGANENDLAVVLYIRGKVIQYNIKCKTLKTICDLSGGDFPTNMRHPQKHSFRFIESLMPV